MASVNTYIGKSNPTVDFFIIKCIHVNLILIARNNNENTRKIVWLNIQVILEFKGNFSTIKLIRICWLSLAAAEIPIIHNQINKYFPSSVAKTCSKCTNRASIPRNTSMTNIVVISIIKYPSTLSREYLLIQAILIGYFILLP
jgi:hypothetical protein